MAKPERVSRDGNQDVTADSNINGWALSPEERKLWHDKIESSLIEIQKELCERCKSIKFKEILGKENYYSKWTFLGLITPLKDDFIIDYDPKCGICTIISTGRNRFALLVPHTPSDPLHIRDLRTTLAAFQIEILGSCVTSHGALSSPKLGWPVNTEKINFDDFRYQLAHCKENHIVCQRVTGGYLKEFNVIDCQTRQIIPAPNHCDYIALSYVWGTAKNISLSQSDTLPYLLDATIEDALVVTHQLGFKYLWIDRYCISQENKDTESKKNQIQNMNLVYQNAQLTIIAAAGNDASFGLPGVNGKARIARENVIFGPGLISSIPSTLDSLLKCSKWMTRGWTLQEAVFSRRRLIFTQEQLFLQCHCVEFSEGIPNTPVNLYAEDKKPLLKWEPSISFGIDDGIQGLVRTIELYSIRDLTYDYDALRAFQGILSVYESQEICHNWGVPQLNLHLNVTKGIDEPSKRDIMDGFVFGLCWRTPALCKRRIGFPSWSWTGWKGQIRYDWFDEREKLMKSTDVEVSVELEDGRQLSWIEYQQFSQKEKLSAALSPFIWITAWCIPLVLRSEFDERSCSVVVTTFSGETRSWNASVMEAQDSKDNSIYAESKKGLHTGILLAPREVAEAGHYYPYVLIVEHKEDWAEKIGFCVLDIYSMRILTHLDNVINPGIVKLLPWVRRTIRVG